MRIVSFPKYRILPTYLKDNYLFAKYVTLKQSKSELRIDPACLYLFTVIIVSPTTVTRPWHCIQVHSFVWSTHTVDHSIKLPYVRLYCHLSLANDWLKWTSINAVYWLDICMVLRHPYATENYVTSQTRPCCLCQNILFTLAQMKPFLCQNQTSLDWQKIFLGQNFCPQKEKYCLL